MINLDKFLKGEIVYQISSKNVEDFLKIIEKKTDLKWRSEDKPTEFIPPDGSLKVLQFIEDDVSVLMNVDRLNDVKPCLEYILNPHYIDYDEKPMCIFQ